MSQPIQSVVAAMLVPPAQRMFHCVTLQVGTWCGLRSVASTTAVGIIALLSVTVASHSLVCQIRQLTDIDAVFTHLWMSARAQQVDRV